MFPRDARAGFLGRGTLGPEPGTPPPSVGWPPFRTEPRAFLGAETKSSQICLPAAFSSPLPGRHPREAPSQCPGDREGRRAEGPVGCARCLACGASCAEEVGVGRTGGRDPGTEGCSMGRGMVGITACSDRLKNRGGPPLIPICPAAKLGRAVRARAACGRGRPEPFSRAFGVLSSRQVLCLEGDCQLRRGLPPPSPNLYPLR